MEGQFFLLFRGRDELNELHAPGAMGIRHKKSGGEEVYTQPTQDLIAGRKREEKGPEIEIACLSVVVFMP